MHFNLNQSTFSQSFFARIRGKKNSQISPEQDPEKEIEKYYDTGTDEYRPYLDRSYILMVMWIVLANLNVLFCIFTWNSYTRLVAGENYKSKKKLQIIFYSLEHVDDFGAYAWIAAFFALIFGIASDAFAKCIKSRPVKFGKLFGVWLFVIFNLIVGVVWGFLQVKI